MKTIIHCAASLSIPLTAIYNLSLSTAQFPDGMKISKCIVLFKGGIQLPQIVTDVLVLLVIFQNHWKN